MTQHDTTRLRELGRRHKRLLAQLAEVKPLLEAEIQAAAEAKVPQVDIVEWSGYKREWVRLAANPEARAARAARERDARKKAAAASAPNPGGEA
jgi:hypothetical protein